MFAEIEAGHVEVVITKDLSRLGRNSSLTGLYINHTFPQYGVRYIAINDHFVTIDPNSTDSDMAGIKNWLNECGIPRIPAAKSVPLCWNRSSGSTFRRSYR